MKPTYLKSFKKILRVPRRLYEFHKKWLLTASHPLTEKQNPVSLLTFSAQPGTAHWRGAPPTSRSCRAPRPRSRSGSRSLPPPAHGPAPSRPASAPTSAGEGRGKAGEAGPTGRPLPHRAPSSRRGPAAARRAHLRAPAHPPAPAPQQVLGATGLTTHPTATPAPRQDGGPGPGPGPAPHPSPSASRAGGKAATIALRRRGEGPRRWGRGLRRAGRGGGERGRRTRCRRCGRGSGFTSLCGRACDLALCLLGGAAARRGGAR